MDKNEPKDSTSYSVENKQGNEEIFVMNYCLSSDNSVNMYSKVASHEKLYKEYPLISRDLYIIIIDIHFLIAQTHVKH